MRALALLVVLSFGCQTAPDYADDVGFLPSAPGGSPEYVVTVNEHPCTDLDGKGGLCTLRLRADQDLRLGIQEKPYAYHVHVVCSDELHVDEGLDVPARQRFDVIIDHAHYAGSKAFVCIGEVFPQDRTDKVSATFEVRVKVIEPGYAGREEIQLFKKDGASYLNLGRYARSAYVWDRGQWKVYSEQTVVQVWDTDKLKAYSESYGCRFNYFGF